MRNGIAFQEWLKQYIRLMERVRDGEEEIDWTLPRVQGVKSGL
jgi:hypothetical protein